MRPHHSPRSLLLVVALATSLAACSIGDGDGAGPGPEVAAAQLGKDLDAAATAGDPEGQRGTPSDRSYGCGGVDGLQDSHRQTESFAGGDTKLSATQVGPAVEAATDVLVDRGWEVAVEDRDTRPEVWKRHLNGPDSSRVTITAQPDNFLLLTGTTGCFRA